MVIYKTTNLKNGKFYIGKDTKNKKSYLGSGVALKRAIAKYGKDNFKKEIIDTADTIEELCEKEIFWIDKTDAIRLGYNIACGGEGGDTYSNNPNKKSQRENRRNGQLKRYSRKEERDKAGKHRIGKAHTQKTKDLIRKSQKGVPKTDEHKKALSKSWDSEKHNTPEIIAKRTAKLKDKNKKIYTLQNLETNEKVEIIGFKEVLKFLNTKKHIFYKLIILKSIDNINGWICISTRKFTEK